MKAILFSTMKGIKHVYVRDGGDDLCTYTNWRGRITHMHEMEGTNKVHARDEEDKTRTCTRWKE